MNTSQVAKDMAALLEKHLPFEIPNFKKRVRITADVDKFKWKEDESVWAQKRERAVHSFECLFDGEFVCFFDMNDTEMQIIVRMLEGLRKLFNEKKVFVHPEMYEVIREEQKAARKAEIEKQIKEIPKAENEGEEMVARAIKQQLEKKKGK